MRVLLAYPKFPDTFWSFKHALKFTPTKKATHPPLGLLTVAAMLPAKWDKKLVDLNIERLTDEQLEWADFVFISAMAIQKASVEEIVARCKAAGVKTVAGGPYFTGANHDFEDIDYLILNEAEITLQPFLSDLENGYPKHVYSADVYCDIEKTPIPAWELLDMKKYISMSIQYSRGCPFDCDFCDITRLCGRIMRTKTAEQVISELQYIYDLGWRAGVFFVDDNFIATSKKLKREILPALTDWMHQKNRSFSYITQASVNLADDEELMRAMTGAGFDTVFVGIETPDAAGLDECNKNQNKNRNLLATVQKMQRFGFQVQGGFIVGFDSDTESIFRSQIEFIQNSGIVTAMVGLLNAINGTRLHSKLAAENRLVEDTSGDNTDFSINFVPRMGYEKLIAGYREIVRTIYSPEYYYRRVSRFLNNYVRVHTVKRFRWAYASAFFISIWKLGIIGPERLHYWRLFFRTMFTQPRYVPLAVTLAIYGYHFRKVFDRI